MSPCFGGKNKKCIFAKKSKMKDSVLSYKYFRSGAAWIFFILGIVLYYIGYFQIDSQSVWKEIFIKGGDILIIGVILGYLSNAAQFLGIFKQDLQDIIYGKEFIKQRKDITPLWETISKQMFKNKFPAIHKEFLKVINGYFPENEVSFYNDYESHITIEWIDSRRGVIRVIDSVSFELIADSTDEFEYPLKTWTRVKEKETYENKITELIVNNQTPIIENVGEYHENDDICHEQKVKLKGSTKYEIRYVREKTYNINEDYYIGFRAKYIVNKLRVCLDYPDDIDAIFTCRGTQLDFEDVKNSKRRIEKKYKSIILPRQGYIFALRKIK